MYPEGGLRLAGDDVVLVDDAASADVLVCPTMLSALAQDRRRWESFWSEREVRARPQRVVCFDVSDAVPMPPQPGAIYLRCGLTRAQLAQYPTAVAFPWPAPDLGRWAAQYPAQADRWDVAFVGWRTPLDVTPRACWSIGRTFGARAHYTLRDEFHGDRHRRAGNHRPGEPLTPDGHLKGDLAENERREQEYRDAVFGASLSLAPQSIVGVMRYRIGETMAAGRVPVWIGHDYVLPFADRLPWADVCVFVPTEHVDRTGDYCAEWLATHDVAAAGRHARQCWERWLDPNLWPALTTQVVRERLAVEA
ncbi:MAG: hypothetical protein Q8O71_01640 [bacterium]|nr:hypothetical protein [bacterium]